MKSALIIFTRNPELGKCKTRLAKSIGDKAALEIYKYLLRHTAKICKQIDADRFVFYSETIRSDDLWDNQLFKKRLQQGSDLGLKMKNAFDEVFGLGYDKVAIVGSDLLDLDPTIVEESLQKLNENDVVIGPAEDGGYYLLAMKHLHPKLFANKNWGTDSVLTETLADLQNHNIYLLKELNDIDTFADLKASPNFKINTTLQKIVESYD